MVEQGSRYRAFISYAHVDRHVVARLHRALETFRVPRRLIGRETPFGPVPARLTPIFKDRDELPASGDLSGELRAALAGSAALIVVCSPAAARSRWVETEVASFIALHGRARVLALIVDGTFGAGDRQCFPPTLADPEPIAADMRAGGDGRRGATLKIVAGLTGLGFDELVQRDAQRRARRATILSAASLTLVLVMIGLTLFAVHARREADRRRGQAEGLIEYMLTDLRKKLEPVGRLDALEGVGQRAMAY